MFTAQEGNVMTPDPTEYVRLIHAEARLMAQVKALREALQWLANIVQDEYGFGDTEEINPYGPSPRRDAYSKARAALEASKP